jgi:hypothetical protein
LSVIRSIFLLLAVVSSLVGLSRAAEAKCSRHQAEALAADARRATVWNWGWGSLFAASTLGHAGLALWVDDRDRKVALWTGVAKSAIGTVHQIVNPIRIGPPESDCHDLDGQLARAAEIERKRRGWFPHVSGLALNLIAFAYVAYETRDYTLATSGALLGFTVGEMTIFTTPNEVRDAGYGIAIVPQVGSDSVGLQLGGSF